MEEIRSKALSNANSTVSQTEKNLGLREAINYISGGVAKIIWEGQWKVKDHLWSPKQS